MTAPIVCKCGEKHWIDSASVVCWNCKEIVVGKSRGLGDTIHKITTALHLPHCGGCEQRRDTLNKIMPYKK